MSIKSKITLWVKSLPAGRRLHLVLLSCYKAIITPLRRRRLQRFGFRILGELNEVFKRNHVEYYLAFGTLLGMMREGGFIAHDDDKDLLVNSQDTKDVKKVVAMMLECGFKFKHVLVASGKILYYTFEKYGVSVDLWCFDRLSDNSGFYFYLAYTNLNVKYERANQCNWYRIKQPNISLGKKIKMRGAQFMIPDNAIEMLEAFYGKGWKTPDRNWVAEDSPRKFEDMPGFAENIDSIDLLNLTERL